MHKIHNTLVLSQINLFPNSQKVLLLLAILAFGAVTAVTFVPLEIHADTPGSVTPYSNNFPDTSYILADSDPSNDDDSGNDAEPDVTTRSATNIGSTSATLNGRVDGNGSSTDVWFEWGRDRDDLDEETDEESTGSGTDEFSERITGLRRDTIYYFRAVAENNEGQDEGSIFSFRTDDNDDNDNSNDDDNQSSDSTDLTAVTTPATSVSQSGAQLNALILNSSNDDVNTWFEWGPSLSLSNKTRETDIGSQPSVRNTITITGLLPGTAYYFRAVAENSDWRNNGSVLSFVTPGPTNTTVVQNPPTTVVRNTTTVVNNTTSVNSPVMLKINGGSELITNNERREYTVTWENNNSQALGNIVLRVTIPESMSFVTTNKGTFSNEDGTLNYDVGTLGSKETSELIFMTQTGNDLKEGEILVLTANLVYTNPAGVQGDAFAYVKHTAYTGGSVLGASAFGAGFLPGSVFEWLFLLILLLIFALLVKYLIGQSSSRKQI